MANFTRLATSKQFEEAFEDLYKQSPMPKLSKQPFCAPREKPVQHLPVQTHARVGIKAIFDMMKEKNSSISSEFNTSIVTSNTSFGGADIEIQPGELPEHAKEKEIKTPEKCPDKLDRLSENYYSPKAQEMPPKPASPAVRAALNFARHAAVLDNMTWRDNTVLGSRNIDRQADRSRNCGRNLCDEITFSRIPENSVEDDGAVEVSGDGTTGMIESGQKSGGVESRASERLQQEMSAVTHPSLAKAGVDIEITSVNSDRWSCLQSNQRQTRQTVAGKTATQVTKSLLRNGQTENLKNTGTTAGREIGSGETTSEPSCNSTGVTKSQNLQSTDISPPVILDSIASPAPVAVADSLDESRADQETLQLVSKLVQRLHSNTETDSDDSGDDCDVTNTAKPVSLNLSRLSKNTDASQSNKSVMGCNGSQAHIDESSTTQMNGKNIKTAAHTSSSNKEGNSILHRVTRSSESHEPEELKTSAKNSKQESRGTMQLRRREKTAEKKPSRARMASVLKSFQIQASDAQSIANIVEDDIVHQKLPQHVHGSKDPFSLDTTSSGLSEVQVEEDTVAFAGKKLKSSKSETRKRKNPAGTTSPEPRTNGDGKKPRVTATESDGTKIKILVSWSLDPVARFKSVRILGRFMNTDCYWRTSVIVERISSRVLKSAAGSVYRLVGNLSGLNTRDAGFSQEITRLFRSGFPPNWKELVESSVTGAELNTEQIKNTLPEQSRRCNSGQKLSERKSVEARRHTPSGKRAPVSYHTPRQPEKNDSSLAIWTPQGVMTRELEAGVVCRTQSGRCIIPPLARWAGQYLKRDDSGNVTIGFASLAAEKHFAKIAEEEMHVHVNMRNSQLPSNYSATKAAAQSRMVLKKQCRASYSNSIRRKENSSKSGPLDTVKEKALETKKKCQKSVKSVVQPNVSVDHLAEEVMALVQKSKEKRMQKTVRKTVTCYSRASVQHNKTAGSGLSKSSEFSEEETISIRRVSQITTTNTESASTAVCSTSDAHDSLGRKGMHGRPQTRTKFSESVEQGRVQANTPVSVISSSNEDSDFEEKAINFRETRKKNVHNLGQKHRKRNGSSQDTADSDSGSTRIRGKSKQRYLSHQTKQNSTGRCRNSHDSLPDLVLSTRNNEIGKMGKQSAAQRRLHSNKIKRKEKDSQEGEGEQSKTETKKIENVIKNSKQGRGRSRKTQQGERDQNADEISIHSEESELSGSISDFDSEDEVEKGLQLKHQNKTSEVTGKRFRPRASRPQVSVRAQSKRDKASALVEPEGSLPWSKKERKSLQQGIEHVSSDHPHYWEAVSEYVGTRSSKECASFYLQDKPDKQTKGKSRTMQPAKAKEGIKTPVVQARRGTLKRRQQLRAVLEHDNNNNQDDLFQATPFRIKKKARVTDVDFGKTDEEVFGRNPNFFTPKSDGSHQIGRAFSHTPASSRKTPTLNTIHSPWQGKDSAQKRDLDQYIYRLNKNKRQLTKSFNKKKSQQLKENNTNPASSSAVHLSDQSAAPEGLFQIREEKSCDDEDEEDYYYSEDEES